MEIITKCLENNIEINQLRRYINDDKTPVYATGVFTMEGTGIEPATFRTSSERSPS